MFLVVAMVVATAVTVVMANMEEEIFHHVVPQFRMRYRAQVKETNVVQWRDEKYRIISVDRYPLDNEMVIRLDKINE